MINFIINRRKAFLFLFIILLFLGYYSYKDIPREEYPDVQIPMVFVSFHYEGISPEDGENMILRPVEKEITSIAGIKNISSYAIEGNASIILEFEPGFNSNNIVEEVRERIDVAKPQLPKDIEEPRIKEIIFSEFPILNVIISGELSERKLVSIARRIEKKIEELSNVLEVNIAGNLEDTVEIIIDPIKLESYSLSSQIIEEIIVNNKIVTAGNLISSSSRYGIKIPGLIENISDIGDIPIKSNGDKIVRISDIAEVKKSYKPRSSYARVNGLMAVTLEVSKRSGKNIIETIEQIKSVIDKERDYLPKNLNIIYSQDSSERIIESVGDLQNNIILAILLVFIVLLVTIGLGSALLVALSIPATFMISLFILHKIGVTLNVVVLFALILSVGLIVDCAIVITEYADRKLNIGKNSKAAYVESVGRMSIPIIISTITTLIVFMPLLFWPGVVGQFMYYIPLTLIITLTVSLFTALIFVPVIGSWARKRIISEDNLRGQKFSAFYIIMVKKVLNHPIKFLIFIIVFLFLVIILFKEFGKGSEFFPKIEPDNVLVRIRARGNLSIDQQDYIVRKAESRILQYSNQVRVFYTRVGKAQGSRGGQSPEDTIAVIQMELQNWRYRKKAEEILNDISNQLSDIPGIIIEAEQEKKGPGKGKDIQIEVRGRNPIIIDNESKKLIEFINNKGQFKDVEDSRPIPSIEWKFDIDKELAMKYGITIDKTGNVIKLVTNGVLATSYRPEDSDDEVDIIVRFPEKFRNLRQFETLKVILEGGKAVPVSNFVRRSSQQEISKIDRSDGSRIVNIRANMEKGALTSKGVLEIKDWINQNIDKRVDVIFKGEDEDSNETSTFLKTSFTIALLTIALILVLQFNSIYRMFIILSAAYLSTIGVLLGLLVTGTSFGIVMCGLGIIALAGIVVNNNIIFIDTYAKFKKESSNVKHAILRTARARLRPILLTSSTTVLGLLPMVFSMNINFINRDFYIGSPSSQWWQQLSTTIAGGLIFSTILTLFLTPALLLIGDRFYKYCRRYFN